MYIQSRQNVPENVKFSFNKRKLQLQADLISTKIDKLNKQLIEMNFSPLRPKEYF